MGDDVLVVNEAISIPLAELQFRFSTSGGPGGQHANRAATRVTVSFDIAHSPGLPEPARARLLARLASQLTSGGVLQLSADSERSQHQNRAAALERLRQTLAAALKKRKKRRPTRPSRAARERRLQAKKERGQRKAERQKRWDA